MTEYNNIVWSRIDKKYQITRLTEWANMLEKRVAELDPLYRGYHWGRIDNEMPKLIEAQHCIDVA
jgi:hypothetical protein